MSKPRARDTAEALGLALTGGLPADELLGRVDSALEKGPTPPETLRSFVPPLVELLRSQDVRVKCQAARLLGRIGPAAEQAVLPLAVALQDTATVTVPVACYDQGMY